MLRDETPNERIREYLKRLTPQARSRLLAEVERLQLCGGDIPGSDLILAELRAEFRNKGQIHDRASNPSRYFFQPLEPLLVERAAESANSGQISRGSLATIWQWINENLLPTMAHDYADTMKRAVATNNLREAQQVALAFQIKVTKYLESMLASADGAEHARAGLSVYTSSPAIFDDLTKMLSVLRARDALAEFSKALPTKIDELEDEQLAKVIDLVGSKN